MEVPRRKAPGFPEGQADGPSQDLPSSPGKMARAVQSSCNLRQDSLFLGAVPQEGSAPRPPSGTPASCLEASADSTPVLSPLPHFWKFPVENQVPALGRGRGCFIFPSGSRHTVGPPHRASKAFASKDTGLFVGGLGRGRGGNPTHLFVPFSSSPTPGQNEKNRFLADPIWNLIAQTAAAALGGQLLAPSSGAGRLPARPARPRGDRCVPSSSSATRGPPVACPPEAAAHGATGRTDIIYYNIQGRPTVKQTCMIQTVYYPIKTSEPRWSGSATLRAPEAPPSPRAGGGVGAAGRFLDTTRRL